MLKEGEVRIVVCSENPAENEPEPRETFWQKLRDNVFVGVLFIVGIFYSIMFGVVPDNVDDEERQR